jgi:hypothetical protein
MYVKPLARALAIATLGTLALMACGDSCADTLAPDTQALGAVRPVPSYGPNVVSFWSEIGANTVNLPPAASGTPEEQRPFLQADLATLHLAIYDALVAIVGGHKPYAIVPQTPAAGASLEAAANAAAYGVLKGLFPNRSDQYQSAYDQSLVAIPDGDAKRRGIVLGTEVAAGMLALRANDGRAVALGPYAPGTLPGQFRGTDPVAPFLPYMKPFTLTSADQFRPDGPPPLTSTTYADDLNETKARGALNSMVRTPAQTERARFHSERPDVFWSRNLRRFATSQASIAEDARLMAMLFVSQADALIACFDAKYHFASWRPYSAITLADTDGNPATEADPSWQPVLPTPNDPEYPAAHACATGAFAETLQTFYGTKKVVFQFDSVVTGMTHTYDSTDAIGNEVQAARIDGGMHFRTSTVHGAMLGRKVLQWMSKHYFGPSSGEHRRDRVSAFPEEWNDRARSASRGH